MREREEREREIPDPGKGSARCFPNFLIYRPQVWHCSRLMSMETYKMFGNTFNVIDLVTRRTITLLTEISSRSRFCDLKNNVHNTLRWEKNGKVKKKACKYAFLYAHTRPWIPPAQDVKHQLRDKRPYDRILTTRMRSTKFVSRSDVT